MESLSNDMPEMGRRLVFALQEGPRGELPFRGIPSWGWALKMGAEIWRLEIKEEVFLSTGIAREEYEIRGPQQYFE